MERLPLRRHQIRPMIGLESAFTCMSTPPSPQPQSDDAPTLVSRAAVRAQIEARLAGKLSDQQLARWAFDHFYAEELGEVEYEPEWAEQIADALDALMFGDDPHFRQTEEELRALLARLQQR